MLRVGRVVVVGLVARDAGRRLVVVDLVRVAVDALGRQVLSGQRERRLRVVIVRRAGPLHRGMARRAQRGEAGGGVVRVGRRVELRLVTRRARGRLPLEDVVGVTACARGGQVRPREREERLAVIEGAPLPRHVVVTRLARRREPRALVRRGQGAVVVGQVARDARGRLPVVDPVGVAIIAAGRQVAAVDREAGGVVVELAAGPGGRGMTARADGGETGCRVRRVLRAAVVGLVAPHAGGRRPLEDAIAMTIGADRGLVRPGQGKRGRIVVERRTEPRRRRVARLARSGKARRRVRRILRLREVRLVARQARRRLPLVHAVRVAVVAGGDDMLAREREARGAVVEHAAGPLDGRVARLAGAREARGGMRRRRRCAEVGLVARHALLRATLEDAIRVAIIAHAVGMPVGQLEAGRRVVEGRPRPLLRPVAVGARLREAGLEVRRVGRRVVLRLVTRSAGHRLADVDLVVVAIEAGGRLVPPGEGEARLVVVERRPQPRHRVLVARLAERGEAGRRVRRGTRGVVGRTMARHARLRLPLVDEVGVARLAHGRRVLPRQREARGVVVELRPLPARHRMARQAGLTEACGRMLGGRRLLEVGLVAADAAGRLPLEHLVGVALGARGRLVRPQQRELRQVVIELGPLPLGRRVAVGAERGEATGVRRVERALIVLRVARHARHRLVVVHLVGVTRGAGAPRMPERQREARLGVIEGRVVPRDERVAGRAVLGERRRLVVGRLDGPHRSGMAADARRRTIDELQLTVPGRRVARLARYGRVPPAQREAPRLVHLRHLRAVVERPRGVAPRALCPELALVHVLVARGARGRGLREVERHVARLAGRLGVCPFERERLGRVFEARRDHRGLPPLGLVAGTARPLHRESMRVVRALCVQRHRQEPQDQAEEEGQSAHQRFRACRSRGRVV